jgi:hypothetical protein
MPLRDSGLAASNIDLTLAKLLLLLLNDRLNESRLACQINTMLLLQVVNVIG